MYINSCIPWDNDPSKFKEILSLTYRVGYQAAIINIRTEQDYKNFMDSGFFPQALPQISLPATVAAIKAYQTNKSPLPICPRITLTAESAQDLKKKLGKWENRQCLIAVESNSKEVLEIAARDGRVDIIAVPSQDYQKILTKGIISLAKQNNCTLDISITPVVKMTRTSRSKILRTLYRLFLLSKINISRISLGAYQDVTLNPFFIRGPKETLAFFASMFDFPIVHLKKILSSHPEALFLRFIKDHHHLILEEDVEIVGIGKEDSSK